MYVAKRAARTGISVHPLRPGQRRAAPTWTHRSARAPHQYFRDDDTTMIADEASQSPRVRRRWSASTSFVAPCSTTRATPPRSGRCCPASLFGAPRARGGPLLAELAHAHLILQHMPGRYSVHDLLRAYAMEQADIWDTVADRRASTFTPASCSQRRSGSRTLLV
jgi:hypothetical protein